MKYKIGDKVRYDGGDWWFYATVSAVFEHPICPCYRLNVERMEKKSCKFSLTQFEYELEADNEIESGKSTRKWENSDIEDLKRYYGNLSTEDLSKALKRSPQAIEDMWLQIKPEAVQKQEPKQVTKPELKMKLKPEPEPKVKLKPEPEPKTELKPEPTVEPEVEQKKKTRMRKTSDAWDKNFELYREGKKSNVINAWKAKNRKDYKTGILSADKLEKLVEINFTFDSDKNKKQEKVELTQHPKKEVQKRKRGEAWDENLEAYRKGEKSNIINTWIAYNRKQYKDGKLSDQKFEKLMEINFPFETEKKRRMK